MTSHHALRLGLLGRVLNECDFLGENRKSGSASKLPQMWDVCSGSMAMGQQSMLAVSQGQLCFCCSVLSFWTSPTDAQTLGTARQPPEASSDTHTCFSSLFPGARLKLSFTGSVSLPMA